MFLLRHRLAGFENKAMILFEMLCFLFRLFSWLWFLKFSRGQIFFIWASFWFGIHDITWLFCWGFWFCIGRKLSIFLRVAIAWFMFRFFANWIFWSLFFKTSGFIMMKFLSLLIFIFLFLVKLFKLKVWFDLLFFYDLRFYLALLIEINFLFFLFNSFLDIYDFLFLGLISQTSHFIFMNLLHL